MWRRPEAGEYDPYYSTYISQIPEGNILDILDQQMTETLSLLASLSEEQALFRYAPDKWSIKEVIGHIADAERVMAYRLLRIARGDTTPLPGFEQDLFIANASFDEQPMQEILGDLVIVRQSTLHLLKSLTQDAWLRQGTASDSPVTVRALAYIIASHEPHHRRVIQERYMGSDAYPSK